ncbi:hypothetical protein COX69_01560 [Candidatus Falkowbacteria bacterium CG_4_10_14_0_2_um_filter_48_10]|uniref:DDH domain-containing protein n=1 Tax=Candidatus Falkowbacteria bacterium CG23_combo_of_CG06-09_8_20_14_all_49_15 TaxID=1974572 RepID=A0A2G9ZNJ1_9BACT|nr:MAG: hypothetical protein COX22_00620 [Candidatus Falkowbacteria bacterium CG23_combo_of_CG06-09_8_20_14_all_49_15]PJA08680.1 MAG: hypothetical protein COX69_01560 [Candidatus Falkowbacteria bacterium CG_4_10_14_0_2_um_filter_48_10]
MLSQSQQIFERIKKSGRILISFGRNWDSDALASALALYLFLRQLGKNVTLTAEKKLNAEKLCAFLPSCNAIENTIKNRRQFVISLKTDKAKVGQVKYVKNDNALDFIITPKEGFFSPTDVSARAGDYGYDLIIIAGTPDIEALGGIYTANPEFFYQVPVVNIDCHSANEEYGQINLVDITAVATAEIVFNLLCDYDRSVIDEDIATCLLFGLIAETRNFKTQNITPQSLSVASQLMAMGGRREEIANRLYRSRPLAVLKLWGRILARLNEAVSGKLVWSVLTRADFEKTGAGEDDIAEAIDELIISLPEAKTVIIFYETASAESTQMIISAVKNINVLMLAKEYAPIGSASLATAGSPLPLAEAEKEVIAAIKDKMEKMPI